MPFDYTGSFSGSFIGDLTSTNGVISSSAQLPSGVVSSSAQLPSGIVSSSTQVNYTQLQNKPVTISPFQKNSIVANNNFRENTFPTISSSFASRIETLETSGDAQTLSFNSSTNALTISNGNSVDLSSLAGGGVGGSGLAITASDEGVVLSQNVRSIDFVGNAVTATNSGNAITITINTGSAGASSWNELAGKPSGLVSSSAQITITEAQISDLTHTEIPSGTVSSSTQITSVITDSYISASAAASGFGAGGGTSDFTQLTNVPSGLVSGSTQITDVVTDSYISASAAASGFGSGGGETYTAGAGISIAGNVISIDTSSTHFKLGVSASAAYYGFSGDGGGSFGDPPVITTTGLQIAEYKPSGTAVGVITATDVTPGDTQTWATQSGYTDGFFSIDAAGGVTASVQTSASMNTTAGSGSNNAHPFLVQVTDGQNNTVTGTIYIYVRPNQAPVFRQTSVGGSIITSFTSSAVNENSTAGSTIATIYFTDAEGDVITIGSGSWSYGDSSHFTITKNSTNVVITQATSSLDYETYDHYQFYLTASDAKYPSPDADSITYLPVRIVVGDNEAPTLSDQSVTGVNENSSDGQSAGTVTITDTEGDTSATIVSMTLRSAYLNGVGTNITSSLSGTSLYDPHADPFTFSGKTIIRKNGVYLNSDVANRYEYRVGVKDAFNADINYGIVTIPIANDAVSTVTDNWTNVYVIESAVDGDSLYINSNGRTGTVAQWSSTTSQRWEVSSDGDLVEVTSLTGSSTQLRLKNNVSGSIYSYDGTNTINVALTASEHGFETTKQYIDLAVNVAINNAPVGTYAATSANLNTNGARPSNTLYTLTWADAESNSLNHSSFTLTSNADITSSWNGGYVYTIKPGTNLSAGTYYISASVKDQYGFHVGTKSQTMTIAQAGSGTLTTNGTFYVIESAVSGALIYTNSNGRSGTQGDLGVTYSPQYNSAAVQSFTSSNAMVHVSANGALSIAQNVSSSVYTYDAGNPITTNITWQDQYGNVGGPTQISINVAINNAPSVSVDSPDSSNRNTNLATTGTRLAQLTWNDTESDALNVSSFTLSGAGAASLSSSYNGSNTFGIYANGNLTAGDYGYTASIKDVHGFRTGTYKDALQILQAGGGTINSENFYIIESAVSGAFITNTSTGIGSQADVNVTYALNYGNPVAEQFRTLDSVVYIDSDGRLSVKQDISGSYNGGSSLSPTIYWVDQYGNEGTGSITVNITNNGAATATFTNSSVTAPVSQGTTLVSVSISDTESDSPYSLTLSGLNAASMSAQPQNAASSSWLIKASDNSMTNGMTLYYTASVTDAYGETTTNYSRQFVVGNAVVANPLVYVYDIGLTSTNFNNTLGYQSSTLATPSTLSTPTVFSGFGFVDAIQSSSYGLGNTSIVYNFGAAYTATLLASASLSSLTDISSSLGYISKTTSHRIAIIIPSGSAITDVPTSMDNGYGTAVSGRYVLEYAVDGGAIGAGLGTSETSYIHKVTLDSAVNGYSDYIIISNANTVASSTNILLDIRPNDSQP